MDLKGKIIVLLISFLIQFPLSGQQIRDADYYFDGTDGNDSNDGLTPATAWKTLNKFNVLGASITSKSIAFRDSIDYRRSTVGTAAILIDYNGVRITNWYGSNSDILPRILASDSKISNWSDQGGNIWSANASVGNNTLYFEFADSIRWGRRFTSQGDLTQEFRFYISGGTVYCYSPSDPDARYVAVETYDRYYCVNIYGDNCTVEYLELDYGGGGVVIEDVADNNTVRNCIIKFNGTSDGVATGQGGEGVQIWSSGNRISNNYIQESTGHGIHIYSNIGGDVLDGNIIDSNYIFNCHHTGIDINTSGATISNTTIRYNIIFDTPWAAERQEPGYNGTSSGFFFHSSGGGSNSNITLAYNLVYNIYEASGCQVESATTVSIYNCAFIQDRINSSGYGCIQGNNSTLVKNTLCVINNRAATSGSFSSSSSNNLVYSYNGGSTGNLPGVASTSNPLFIDGANFNFRLQAGSPTIDLGIPLGYTEDLDGNPIIGNPDAGAYEGTFGPDITPPEVTDAILQDSVTLYISFSEPLESTSAQNNDNYSITGGISIISVSHSGSQVTLTTSAHSPGTYTVIVTNITDLAGNLINPNHNSAEYERVEDPIELLMLEIVEVTASVIPEPDHHPGKTIDGKGYYQGDPDSRWAGDTMPEWIMFDLGVTNNISLVKLSFYNWNNGRIYNYSLEVSNDLVQWTEVLSNVYSSSAEWTENAFSNIESRYIRVNFISSNQNGWAGLWEAEIWEFNVTPVEEEKSFPEGFKLEQNYPNPFNPTTNIPFTLPKESKVKLSVYNLLGEEIAEITNSELAAGSYTYTFNGSELTAGIYFYRLESENYVNTKKMILLK